MLLTNKLSDLGSNTLNDLINKLNESFAKIDGTNATPAGVNAMLGTLKDKVVKASELPTKVIEKAVVDVLVPALATVGTGTSKQVYTKADADTAFVQTSGLTNTLKTEVVKPAVVDVLVPALATVGTGTSKQVYTKADADTARTLALNTKVNVDGSNAGAIVNALTKDPTFINAAKIHANAGDAGFQSAVREVISQPYFDIPADDSTPITAYW
ncbi:hypothetical protein JTE90_010363 [Oedothorax gibbosus]|uniref:Uncharacterized protein n=1 Tax=Oedothorax gibbosus TaxID=931172 RepID=A0AAV6TP14_9ARAC|nr:hypothetical protein JTE90_010363 [Oedothorax gibbosus]